MSGRPVRAGAAFLAAALAVPALLAAQAREPAAVTPATLARRALPVRHDTVDEYVAHGTRRQFLGWRVYAVAPTTVAGRAAWLVTMNYQSRERGTFQSDTLAVEASTLAPLWHRHHARRDSAVVTFAGRRARGWADREGRPHVLVDHELPPNAFDGSLIRWIVPMLPLAADYQASFTAFSMWSNGNSDGAIVVTGPEAVEIAGARATAWVVRSRSGLRRWVDTTTGRILQEHTPRERTDGFWGILRTATR